MTDPRKDVAARLKSVMAEFDIKSYGALGAMCGGANGSAVSNWMQAYTLPRVPEMAELCAMTGLTLDWIYRGALGALNPQLAVRLNRRVQQSA